MTLLVVCWLRLACDPGVGWSLPDADRELAWEVAHRIEWRSPDLRCGAYDAHGTLATELPVQFALEQPAPTPPPKPAPARRRR